MSVHSSQKYKKKDWTRIRFTEVGSYKRFMERIRKTCYYGNLPLTERLSLPLTERAADLYSEVKARHSVQRLRVEEASEISRNACVSPCTLVLAIIYLEQLKSKNYCYFDTVTPSDLFIVSLIVATKFLNDSGEDDDILNSEWAASVGLSLNKINRLEREFLAAINWEVFVKQNNFWKRLRILEREVALNEGNKRGWFSYSDLENLLDTLNGLALAQTIFTVSAVCLASYTAGLLTIIGSTLLVSHLPKYSMSPPTSPDLSSDVFNTSTSPVTPTISATNSARIEDFELPILANYDSMDTIEFIRYGNITWNLGNERNETKYDNSNYLILVSNYIKTLTDSIQDLPLKIGTAPVDSSYFLHNCCFS